MTRLNHYHTFARQTNDLLNENLIGNIGSSIRAQLQELYAPNPTNVIPL